MSQTANANNGEAHRAESLTVEAERELKQVALDFGCSLLAIAANGLKAQAGNPRVWRKIMIGALTNPMLTFKMRSMS